MAVINVTKDNFDKEIEDQEKPAIIDFWAPWCGPCQWMAPVFEELSEEFKEKLIFGKINVDDEKELASKFGISGIPCLIIMKKGEEVDRIVGFNPKDALKEKLDQFLS